MRVSRLAEMAYVVELDSDKAVELDFERLKSSFEGLIDYAPAFGRVALFFEGELPKAGSVEQSIRQLPIRAGGESKHVLPACFELGDDFAEICRELGLKAEELKVEFLKAEYRVEAIGFTPGFPYMSGVPAPLCGLPRRQSPRPRVLPGSVGLAEDMCGIYPCVTPGGWNLVARTPLVTADMSRAFFRFHVGDLVQFVEIDQEQFALIAQSEAEGK